MIRYRKYNFSDAFLSEDPVIIIMYADAVSMNRNDGKFHAIA
jgi:Ni,Fe-hydrogenase maturation factor